MRSGSYENKNEAQIPKGLTIYWRRYSGACPKVKIQNFITPSEAEPCTDLGFIQNIRRNYYATQKKRRL